MALAVVMLLPSAASAEWFANPFFGRLSQIKYDVPTKENPTGFGIAGGTSPKGILGFEADFTSANEFFGTKADFGSNNIRTLTASVMGGYPIKIGGVTRLRPYGVFGGGLGIAKLGFETFPDYDVLNSLPQQQQNQIYNCLDQFGPFGEDLTPAQIQSCGAQAIQEDAGTGYFGTIGFGGGVMGFIVNHVGARADFRYFKRVPTDEPLDYWRFTIGVVVH